MTSTPIVDLLELMRTRRSVRRFLADAVTREQMEKLAEAAVLAPSAGNRQAFRLVFVTALEMRTKLAEAVRREVDRLREIAGKEFGSAAETYLQNFTHFAEAPLVIAAIHRKGEGLLGALQARAQSSAARQAGEQVVVPNRSADANAAARGDSDALASVSAAIMNLLLCAHALGLGACWMTGPLVAASELESILEVPAGWKLSALIPVGVPAHAPVPPKRRPTAQLVRFVTGQ